MRGFVVLAGLALGCLATVATAQVHVKGYVRKDGTYVAPHVRSAPNTSTLDNYTTKPNYNPYNGKTGTVDPYATPTFRTPSYSAPVYRPYAPAPAYKPPCYFNCKP